MLLPENCTYFSFFVMRGATRCNNRQRCYGPSGGTPCSHFPTRGPARQTESRTARRGAASVSMVAPTSVAFFFPAPPAAAGAKQRLQPLDHLLLPRPAAAAVEGAAVVFLASLPSSRCQAFPQNSLQM